MTFASGTRTTERSKQNLDIIHLDQEKTRHIIPNANENSDY